MLATTAAGTRRSIAVSTRPIARPNSGPRATFWGRRPAAPATAPAPVATTIGPTGVSLPAAHPSGAAIVALERMRCHNGKNLARTLAVTSNGFRAGQHGGSRGHPQGPGPAVAVGSEGEPAEAADGADEGQSASPGRPGRGHSLSPHTATLARAVPPIPWSGRSGVGRRPRHADGGRRGFRCSRDLKRRCHRRGSVSLVSVVTFAVGRGRCGHRRRLARHCWQVARGDSRWTFLLRAPPRPGRVHVAARHLASIHQHSRPVPHRGPPSTEEHGSLRLSWDRTN